MPSSRTEIDRKLHRIVLESDPDQFPTATSIGRALRDAKAPEFSYQRSGGTQFSSPSSIAKYVLYGREIKLLDGTLKSAIPKSNIRKFDSFQNWLAESVIDYLDSKECSLSDIKNALTSLWAKPPYEFPTFDNLYSHLKAPPSEYYLRLSLRILALLRPATIALKSYRLIAPSNLFLVRPTP